MVELAADMSTIQRSVFYFKDQPVEGGRSFYEKIKSIHDLDTEQREFDCGEENTCNLWYTVNDGVLAGTVELIRYVSPTIRQRGTNQSSTVDLQDGQGVNERSHFIFNPANSTFAFEYNHFGPKIGMLYRMVNRLYRDKFDQKTPQSTFAYISAGTAMERLNAAYGVRTVQVRYAGSVLSDNADVDSTLNQSLSSVIKFGNARTIDILLRGEPHAKGFIMRSAEFVSKFLPHGDQSLQNFEKLEVKVQENETGGVEIIDFFKDKMLSELRAVKLHEHSREIDSADFHQKMLRDMKDKKLA